MNSKIVFMGLALLSYSFGMGAMSHEGGPVSRRSSESHRSAPQMRGQRADRRAGAAQFSSRERSLMSGRSFGQEGVRSDLYPMRNRFEGAGSRYSREYRSMERPYGAFYEESSYVPSYRSYSYQPTYSSYSYEPTLAVSEPVEYGYEEPARVYTEREVAYPYVQGRVSRFVGPRGRYVRGEYATPYREGRFAGLRTTPFRDRYQERGARSFGSTRNVEGTRSSIRASRTPSSRRAAVTRTKVRGSFGGAPKSNSARSPRAF